MNRFAAVVSFCAVALLIVPHSMAAKYTSDEQYATMKVTNAWARETTDSMRTGVVYLTIENTTGRNDALINAESNVARSVMLHKTVTDTHGSVAMEHMPTVPLPAGQTVVMEPGGLHIMLMGLSTVLEEGSEIAVRLIYKNAPAQNVRVIVRHKGAKGYDDIGK